jgi:hypothetical protein
MVLGLASSLVLYSLSPALACKGGKVLFEDDFQERDSAWSLRQADYETGAAAVGHGRLFLKPPADKSLSALNMAFRLSPNADVCVTVRFVEAPSLLNASAGIIFWANEFIETNNFMLNGDGTFSVLRWADKTWHSVTPRTAVPNFKAGLGQDNHLRVLTNGQTVTLFLNDVQVARYRAPVPEVKVQVGMRVSSFGTESSAVEFRDFKVTSVP